MHGERYIQLRRCGRMSAARHLVVGAGPQPPGLHAQPGDRAGCADGPATPLPHPGHGAQMACEIHHRSMANRKILETLFIES
jgi:hypothetical protein